MMLPDSFWLQVLPKSRSDLFPTLTNAVVVFLGLAVFEVFRAALPILLHA